MARQKLHERQEEIIKLEQKMLTLIKEYEAKKKEDNEEKLRSLEQIKEVYHEIRNAQTVLNNRFMHYKHMLASFSKEELKKRNKAYYEKYKEIGN